MEINGITNREMIWIDEDPDDDTADLHYIELALFDDKPMFKVLYCCDEDWQYVFMYTKNNYENIKHLIVDAAYECDSMEELVDVLTDIFESEFGDILMDCDGDCENCDYDEDEDED